MTAIGEVESWEELKDLIASFGETTAGAPAPALATGGTEEVHDTVLLRAFMEAGVVGIPASFVQSSLPKAHGRGMRKALQSWASRMKLVGANSDEACQPARPQGKRGWKLSNGALQVAKMRYGGKEGGK